MTKINEYKTVHMSHVPTSLDIQAILHQYVYSSMRNTVIAASKIRSAADLFTYGHCIP